MYASFPFLLLRVCTRIRHCCSCCLWLRAYPLTQYLLVWFLVPQRKKKSELWISFLCTTSFWTSSCMSFQRKVFWTLWGEVGGSIPLTFFVSWVVWFAFLDTESRLFRIWICSVLTSCFCFLFLMSKDPEIQTISHYLLSLESLLHHLSLIFCPCLIKHFLRFLASSICVCMYMF